MADPFSLGGFELDLGNLEKSSGLLITDRKRTASIVNSQDDGPTDFTFNMGQWMKGTDVPKNNDTHQVQAAEIQAVEQPIEQSAPIGHTTDKNLEQSEHQSSEWFSHISGFTDGPDGPICSSTISPVKRRPKVKKQPIDQSGLANDTTSNTMKKYEYHSSDRLSHISFASESDGSTCSSSVTPVEDPMPVVNEDTNGSVYTLQAPVNPRASDEVLPHATISPMPTLPRGSGSSQNLPADDLPRSRRSSDPRAPGSPTPLARQSGLQRNPLVDAIIASRRITSPNSRAAAIVNGIQPESTSAPVQSRSRTNSHTKGTQNDTQPSQSRSRDNSETKNAQRVSQARPRSKSEPKEVQDISQSQAHGNLQIKGQNTTLPSQSRSRSNSQTQVTRKGALPSQSRSRDTSNIQETSNTTLPSQSRSRNNSQTREEKPTLPAKSRSRSNSQTKEHQVTAKTAPALSRVNTETKQNNAAEEVFTHISSLQAEIERLRLENQELRAANSSLERDNASYHTAYENIERAYQGLEREAEQQNEQQNNAYQALDRENSKAQADFENLQDRYRDREKAFASEMSDLKNHFRNYESTEATKLRSELNKVESNSRERETALTSEVKTVKSQCKDHIVNLRRQHETEIQERDAALSLAKQESTTAKKESHTVNKEVAVMREQLVDLNEELADTRTIQTQMEAHFKTAMKAREAEWQERVDVLLKERETMSKALMTEWGRREMGEMKGKDGGQAYRYRYVKAACS